MNRHHEKQNERYGVPHNIGEVRDDAVAAHHSDHNEQDEAQEELKTGVGLQPFEVQE